MADSYLGYQNPSTVDKKLDSESLTVGANTVERERVQIAGSGATQIAPVDATNGLAVDNKTLPPGASTAANQSTELTRIGDVTETAPVSDTASSGLNGRLQRIAQRITSLIALLPSALTGSGNFKAAIVESTATVQVQSNSANIATESTQATLLTQSDFDTKIGSLTETAPASDTASSGLNGRLQRIAQRLTSLIALVPSALTGSGNFKAALVEDTTSNKSVNLAQVAGTTTDTNSGNKSAGTQRVVIATDQPQLTNALKVDGSAVTQPVSLNVPTTVYNGKTTVTTAGTRTTLAASTTVKSVTIKALSTNTGIIYVGDSAVASTNGLQLLAGESISLDIANLNTVNIDASVSGEGVTYLGVN